MVQDMHKDMLNNIMAFSCDAVQIDFFLKEEDWKTAVIDGSVPDSEIKDD